MRRSNPTSLSAGLRPAAGMGMAPAFMCGLCAKPSAGKGQKLQRVRGLRTWVCAACAAKNERS